ncbi:MAG: hypothetical protein AAFV53_03860 [Myxococcota bacterium]
MAQIEVLDRETLPAFLESPLAVLILTKSDCGACTAWSEELAAFLSELDGGDPLTGIRYGKLILNQPGLGFFKKESLWLREVNDLPFNAIYKDGEMARSFAGSGTTRLLNRLKRLMP